MSDFAPQTRGHTQWPDCHCGGACYREWLATKERDDGAERETRPSKPCSLWSWCTLAIGHEGKCLNIAPLRHPVLDARLVSLYDHDQLPRARYFPHADHAGRPLRGAKKP